VTRRARLIKELAGRIDAVERPHPVRVAIDGMDAAGKTTLATELVEPLERRGRTVIRASIDAFHRPRADRYRRGAGSPEGYFHDSFDLARLRNALLDPLGPMGSRRYRTAVFDYRTDKPLHLPEEEAPADAVLLFDGVFLLRPELRECWDLGVLVHVEPAVALARALERDSVLFGSREAAEIRYRARYLPAQVLYLAEADPFGAADIVVYNEPLERPTMTLRTSQTAT
jgi:uridine kinase